MKSLLLEDLTQSVNERRLTLEVVPQLGEVGRLGDAVLPMDGVDGDAVVWLSPAPVGVLCLSVTR